MLLVIFSFFMLLYLNMEQAKKIRGEVQINEVVIKDVQKEVKNIKNLKEKIETNLEKSTTESLEIILIGAIALDSSDIHIEPEEEKAKIRIRIDGMLQDVLEINNKIYQGLTSRIKLLSKLKLNISDRPQDGRFSIAFEEKTIEIRTSSLPAEFGESIVMRILDPKSLISVESLGLRKDLAETFNKEIKKPNGMIIVTGPTGSGKTTTLYAILKKLNQPEVKIITIEDPIEYHLAGVSQTQVDPKKGYDFAKGLRSIMRQDPDVVLVGEVRDLETANIALHAALTGHLVLTPMHTNSAAGTIARFKALGEKPVNISPAINIAIAQRLVRKVCKKCAKQITASSEILEKIEKSLKNVPKNINFPKLDPSLKILEAKGCDDCN